MALARLLSRYEVRPGDLSGFKPILENQEKLGFNDLVRDAADIPDSSGLYLWLVRSGQHQFKAYLGRTNRLSRRFCEYSNAFQPHSPNDFKLHAFAAWATTHDRNATLALYFQPMPDEQVRAAETEAVRQLAPLMNQRMKPPESGRQQLQRAFAKYYGNCLQTYVLDES